MRVGRREALYPHRLHKQNTTEKRQKMLIVADGTAVGTIRTLNDETGWLRYPVKILAFRRRYGTIDAQVTPVGGTGERWVELDRLGEETA